MDLATKTLLAINLYKVNATLEQTLEYPETTFGVDL